MFQDNPTVNFAASKMSNFLIRYKFKIKFFKDKNLGIICGEKNFDLF